ncbi:hypothetical protein [Caproiciproducens sp.]
MKIVQFYQKQAEWSTLPALLIFREGFACQQLSRYLLSEFMKQTAAYGIS